MHSSYRVLLAAMSLDLGGAETHVVTLAKELLRDGHRVVVASGGGRLVHELTAAGIPHEIVSLNSRNPFKVLRSVHAIHQLCRTNQIQLMHAHARIPAWVCNMVSRKARIPVVVTYHGVYASGFPWNLVTVPGDRTIAVSEDVKEHLVTKFGFKPASVIIIPNGIDTEQFKPSKRPDILAQQLGILNEASVVVHVSRLHGNMASVALNLIRAMPRLSASLNRPVQLLIVGDGDQLSRVKQAALDMNERLRYNAVIATGGRLDTSALLLLGDVFVGVARAAMEAMACAKPVVIAGEGGFGGILTEEKMREVALANFTARREGAPVTPENLAAAIEQIITGDKAEQLGAAGLRFVRENLEVREVAQQVIQVYSALLESHDGGERK
ncbi:MAG TPA: glycosyltransferase family 4 protein [Firmicutes bacterium]|nr:glycosyltransferase family 4 protein [Bacillota bacterium]